MNDAARTDSQGKAPRLISFTIAEGRPPRNARLPSRAAMIDRPAMSDPASMTYGQYLSLEALLAAQHPLYDHHDEALFITIHQAKELWLKQMIHELRLALKLVRRSKTSAADKHLSLGGGVHGGETSTKGA